MARRERCNVDTYRVTSQGLEVVQIYALCIEGAIPRAKKWARAEARKKGAKLAAVSVQRGSYTDEEYGCFKRRGKVRCTTDHCEIHRRGG
jgi:hypothetical protein